MMPRVGRLVQAELIKLTAQRFLAVALLLIALGTVVAEEGSALLRATKESSWSGTHAVQLFASGWGTGLELATFVLVILSSMLVSGEFDKGTIKVLLTRPVTRTDFYVSKVLAVLLLWAFLFAFVLYVALGWACLRGNLGPVWDDTAYLVQREAAEINGHAIRAVGICAASFLAAGFLGLLVSTWTESSGYAVAIALILYLLGYFLTKFMSEAVQEKLFFHYAPYAVGKLKEFADGGTTKWAPRVLDRSAHVTVPLVYIAAFAAAAYGLFRRKNIHA